MWNKYIACPETNNYALCVGVKSQCYLSVGVCQFSLSSGFLSVSFGEKDFICFSVISVVCSFHLGCKTCLLSKLLCLDNSVQHSIASANRVSRMQ